MTRKLHFLILEDQKSETVAILRELRRVRVVFAARRVSSEADFLACLDTFHPDLILACYGMAGFSSNAMLASTAARCPGVPLIFYSSRPDVEIAMAAMRRGAADFVPLPQLDRLAPAVQRALCEAKERRQHKDAQPQAGTEPLALLDRAHSAVAVLNLDGSVRYWNESAERVYGWTAREVSKLGLLQTVYASRESSLQEIQKRVLEYGEWTGELRQKHRCGADLLVRSSRSLVRDESGRPQTILIINTDITKEESGRARHARACQLEKMGQAAGDIARELKTLLAPLIANLPPLRQKLHDAASLAILDNWNATTSYIGNILQSLLTFIPPAEGYKTPVRPLLLLEETALHARATYPKSMVIHTEAPRELPLVMGDTAQLRQVLASLCDNARDAMPKGGTIGLSACVTALSEKEAPLQASVRPGNYVMLSVSDNGEGMSSEVIARIFDPFFTTKRGQGRGLSLTAAWGIVKSHQGFFQIESNPGKGSQFRVYLPAASPLLGVDHESAHRPERRAKGETILCAEDEEAISRMVQLTLKRNGFNVLVARNGAEAIALFQQHRDEIQAVLTDINMPLKDGWQFITEVRKIDPAMRIVVMTGRLADETYEKADELKVCQVVEKPLGIGGVAQVMRRVLQESRPPRNPLWPSPDNGPRQDV